MHVNERLKRLAGRLPLPRWTIRLRLTVLYGSIFVASGAVLLIVTNVLVRSATNQRFKAVVVSRQLAQGTATISSGSIDGSVKTLGSAVPRGAGVLFAPPGLSPVQVQGQARQLRTQLNWQRASDLHLLVIYSAVALGVMVAVSIALGWIMAGRALRPLRNITTAARDISANNLNARLVLNGPNDELQELGETVNELLARLETAFEAQRHFVANAAHELRSPLARQRTLAQVALADPEASFESLRGAHERVLASGQQQERLIDGLLTLARGEAGLERKEAVDLSVVVDGVLLTPALEIDQLGLWVEASVMPAMVSGDARLVERLVTNLIDNAMRYNVAGGHVQVTTGVRDSQAVLSVVNDGPVIPPSEIGRLFQSFQRMATDRTGHGDGVGLGLSIVQAVANAHGATISAEARPEGGLAVEVVFPAVDDEVTDVGEAPSGQSPDSWRMARAKAEMSSSSLR